MLRKLMPEIARPNPVASLFLAGATALAGTLLIGEVPQGSERLAWMGLLFCWGGYAGSLWANPARLFERGE